MGTDHVAPGGAWRSALALGLVATLGTGLLAGIHLLTRETIASRERRAVLDQLEQLVAPGSYDNAMHEDHFNFSDERWFGDGQVITVYRARLRDEPVAVVMKLVAPDGYNGAIHLLVGIKADGSLCGVRVTAHKETPGLGDDLEASRSDWILGFSGRSLENPGPAGWAVRKDGGAFDQFTGATITPRAVVKAVHGALSYFAENRRELFDHAAEPRDR